jgi:hypothetical protein
MWNNYVRVRIAFHCRHPRVSSTHAPSQDAFVLLLLLLCLSLLDLVDVRLGGTRVIGAPPTTGATSTIEAGS